MGVKTIKTFAERMRSEGVSRAMMVTIADITPFAKQCLLEMRDKFYIESVTPLPSEHDHHCHSVPARGGVMFCNSIGTPPSPDRHFYG